VDFTEFWDHHWSGRIKGESVEMNEGKMRHILRQLWKKPYLIPLRKLEVGCGTGIHIYYLSQLCEEWKRQYVGVDLSPTTIGFARKSGLQAFCGDITKGIETVSDPLTGAKPEIMQDFQFFLFLDVLEHIPDHEAVAKKVRELASKDGFHIFGNIPLYRSAHEKNGGYEREMNIEELEKFMRACGIEKYEHNVYGINGWPYMTFEGKSNGYPAISRVVKSEKPIMNDKPLSVAILTPWNNAWIPLYRRVFEEQGHQVKVMDGRNEMPDHYDVYLHMWAGQTEPVPGAVNLMFLRRFEFFSFNWVGYDWSKIDRLIFCNQHFKNIFESKVGRDKCQTELVYNVVDPDKWTFAERGHGNKIGMACHVHPKKNLPLAAQILGKLMELGGEPYELHIAGEIQDSCTALYLKGLGLNIKLHGHVEDLNAWWDDKNYCLSTSISEGNPNNVIEAMAKGIMPVVHRWPGAEKQFMKDWCFSSVGRAVEIIRSSPHDSARYDSVSYRTYADEHFGIDNFRSVARMAETDFAKKH